MVESVYQKTLRNPVTCSGIGLHSGQTVTLTLLPSKAGTGITFRRTDVPVHTGSIPARYDRVSATTLGTTISNEYGVSVSTIEHLMAALCGSGIDNALIEVNGPEVPIMDGSSEPFVFLIDCAGTITLDVPRRYLQVLKPVKVKDGKSYATLEPAEQFTLDLKIEFDHAAIARQSYHFEVSDDSFKQSLARARTFGFAGEVDRLRKAGLARGGSLDNAIVIGEKGVLNEGGLRYTDEFVRHKALDCLGDIYLAGGYLKGKVSAYRPGHGINNKLLRALFKDTSAYCWVVDAAENIPLMRAEPVAAYF